MSSGLPPPTWVVVPLQDSYRRLLSLRAGSRVLGFALQPFFRAQPPIKPTESAYGKIYFNLLQVSHYHHSFRLSLVFGLRGIKAAVGSLNYWLF